MKICEQCKKNPFQIKIVEVINFQKFYRYLCENCAKDREIAINSSAIHMEEKETNKLESPLKSSLEVIISAPELLQEKDQNSCPKCGMTYENFRSTSLWGCPQDYFIFEKKIKKILEKIHGSSLHRGKTPSRMTLNMDLERRILSLKEKLKKAIHREEYEKAAELRDQIAALEGESHGS
jgi:protein arginine kinase activator